MNTAEERAEAAAIDVEGRQARIAEILGKSTTGGLDTAIEDTRRRKPAVKGLCVYCGKHHSRHIKIGDRIWCSTASDSKTFSLERKAEPAAQVAGALSQEQASRLSDLIAEKETCQLEWTSADRHAYERKAAYEDARSKLRDFIREITAK